MIVIVILGLFIGLLLGLLGGGGSILAVPALVYGASIPLSAAIPTSLIVVGLSSAIAVLPRLREVRWRLAMVFAGAGSAAAFAGAAVNRLLDPTMVLLGFAALMVISGVQMLRAPGPVGGACSLPTGGINWRSCLPKAIGAGLLVGFLTGLFGVGGGFLIVPALVVLLGLPMISAVATSLVIIVVNAAAAFGAHTGEAVIDVRVTVAFTLAAVVGAVFAGRVASRVSPVRLRRWFGYLVLAVAGYVVVRVVAWPST
ncbi:MAG TPA: sulfite exporter TauE/SafE family protein [Microlunatus sp.]|nr:sulfite exporter TauE/SafE family protein [Microlunatus sp.]